MSGAKTLVKRRKNFWRRGRANTDDEEKSAEILMSSGFFIIFLNMLLGLLPVTVNGNWLSHYRCSISTIYSLTLSLTMGFLSYCFVGSSITPSVPGLQFGTADTIAILILRGAHVVGFIVLGLHGQLAAKRLPKIWNSLVECFQVGVINTYGTSWKEIQKLKKFARRSVFLYVAFLAANVIPKFYFTSNEIIATLSKEIPIKAMAEGGALVLGYLIWDLISLSHTLVSILLNFFILVLIICLKSANHQLKELLESEMESVDENTRRSEEADVHLTTEFQRITRIYALCEGVMTNLSSVFGISLIVEVLVLLGNTLVNLFFFICLFLFDKDMLTTGYDDYYEFFSNCFYNFFFFFQLSVAATALVNESRKPLELLKGFQYEYTSLQVKEKITAFKLDITNSSVCLTAKDYFQVNKRLISGLIGAVTTYLIVMIQFKQQDIPQT